MYFDWNYFKWRSNDFNEFSLRTIEATDLHTTLVNLICCNGSNTQHFTSYNLCMINESIHGPQQVEPIWRNKTVRGVTNSEKNMARIDGFACFICDLNPFFSVTYAVQDGKRPLTRWLGTCQGSFAIRTLVPRAWKVANHHRQVRLSENAEPSSCETNVTILYKYRSSMGLEYKCLEVSQGRKQSIWSLVIRGKRKIKASRLEKVKAKSHKFVLQCASPWRWHLLGSTWKTCEATVRLSFLFGTSRRWAPWQTRFTGWRLCCEMFEDSWSVARG